MPHLLAAITGLAAILHASALAFGVIKYLGVAYLLYMAWNTLREDGALKIDDKQEHRKAGRVIGEAILINLLNPKLSIFFLLSCRNSSRRRRFLRRGAWSISG